MSSRVGKTRKQALAQFSERVPCESVQEFVAAISRPKSEAIRSAEVLEIQAEASRQRRIGTRRGGRGQGRHEDVRSRSCSSCCVVMLLILAPMIIESRNQSGSRSDSMIAHFVAEVQIAQADRVPSRLLVVDSDTRADRQRRHCEIRSFARRRGRSSNCSVEAAQRRRIRRSALFESAARCSMAPPSRRGAFYRNRCCEIGGVPAHRSNLALHRAPAEVPEQQGASHDFGDPRARRSSDFRSASTCCPSSRKQDGRWHELVEPPALFAGGREGQHARRASSAQCRAVATDELALADARRASAPRFTPKTAFRPSHIYERAAACFRSAETTRFQPTRTSDRAARSEAQAEATSFTSTRSGSSVHSPRRQFERPRTEIHMLLVVRGRPAGRILDVSDRRSIVAIQLKYSGENRKGNDRTTRAFGAPSFRCWSRLCRRVAWPQSTAAPKSNAAGRAGGARARTHRAFGARAAHFARSATTRAPSNTSTPRADSGASEQVLPLLARCLHQGQALPALPSSTAKNTCAGGRTGYRVRFMLATLYIGLARKRGRARASSNACCGRAEARRRPLHARGAVARRARASGQADEHFREYLRLDPRGQHAEEAGELAAPEGAMIPQRSLRGDAAPVSRARAPVPRRSDGQRGHDQRTRPGLRRAARPARARPTHDSRAARR